ncbi:MFS transporter [Oxalobacter paraformigenes]|nr:MFS transporter [Oxalobacter paraformigenes]
MLSIIWFPAVISISAGYLFMSVAPLSTQFMALFGIGYAGLSLFLSGLLWAHSLVQLPAGLILDKIGVYRGFLIAIFIAMAASLLPFLAPENLALATGLRFMAGLSSGLLFLAGVKVTGMLAPPEKVAQAQGIQGASFCLGTMLPFVTLPYLGGAAWRFSYLIPAALALGAALLSLLLPARVRKSGANSASTLGNLLAALKTVSTSVPIWALGMFHGLSYGTLNNLGQWLPSILADMDGKSTAVAWSLATGCVLLVGTLGRAYGSVFLRWFSRSWITNTAVLAIGILYILLGLAGNVYIGLAVGMLLAVLGGSNYGSIFSLTGSVMSPVYLATAAGFMNMIANIANVMLTLVLGTVREYTGSFSMALCATGLFALLVWFAGRRIINGLSQN